MLLPIKFFFFNTHQPRVHIFSNSPAPPLNNLIHHTSLPALTKKNATKLMATVASVSNYIQSKNEQCVVITSIAPTICSTSFISFMCSCKYIFCGNFQITHLCYLIFLATKNPKKNQNNNFMRNNLLKCVHSIYTCL